MNAALVGPMVRESGEKLSENAFDRSLGPRFGHAKRPWEWLAVELAGSGVDGQSGVFCLVGRGDGPQRFEHDAAEPHE